MLKPISKLFKLNVPSWYIFPFFVTLLIINLGQPRNYVFDETHYIPASREIVKQEVNLNYEHPPLSKFILGYGAKLINSIIKIVDPVAPDIIGYRFVTMVFGLLLIWAIYRWMKVLGFRERSCVSALWLTGFNFVWFVQSKTVMLEIFYICFGVWGTYWIYKSKFTTNRFHFFIGWILVGCALCTKWSALPFLLIAILLSFHEPLLLIVGLSLMTITYIIPYYWVIDLRQNDGSLYQGSFINKLTQYHSRMFQAMRSISEVSHPYRSSFWQWPLLIRPMWYHFENIGGDKVRCVYGGGNPILYWVTFPFLFVIAYRGIRDFIITKSFNKASIIIAIHFWATYFFWIVAPRSTQYFYYYFASSIWLGPLAAWADETYGLRIPKPMQFGRTWFLPGLVLLCGAVFIYFLPILDARLLPLNQYQIYMWFNSWI